MSSRLFVPGRLLFGAALLTSLVARAQMPVESITQTYTSNINVITNGAINSATTRGLVEGKSAGASRGTGASARPAASANLAYTPTAALRQQTVQNYVAKLKPSSPAGAQTIASTFGPGKTDYAQVYRGLMTGSGLRENDATDALTGFMIIGWMVVHNVQDGKAITVPMARGLRAQVAPLLAGNAQARSHAAQVGEELKLQTVIVQSGWLAAIKAGTLAGFRQSIGQLFKTQYGMDLSAVKLTSQGFVKN